MKHLLDGHCAGFPDGYTAITRRDDPQDQAGLGVGVLRLRAGATLALRTEAETAWLLMQGRVRVAVAGIERTFARSSLFDESASCLHAAAGSEVSFAALDDTELTVYDCPNTQPFAARAFGPGDVPNEHRGRGQVRNRSLRFVRTIFDARNSPPQAELVLGEVVTLPGGWSSYPPHHHAQPEIYHYRFTAPQGYGHAELGDAVCKVHQYDTIRSPPGLDHAQCAAPGYGMYYSWVVRHLPGNPYIVPEFTAEHAWTMAPDADFWWPRGIDDER